MLFRFLKNRMNRSVSKKYLFEGYLRLQQTKENQKGEKKEKNETGHR